MANQNKVVCSICTDNLISEKYPEITVPKCGHAFHTTCITEWIQKMIEDEGLVDTDIAFHYRFCPICGILFCLHYSTRLSLTRMEATEGTNKREQIDAVLETAKRLQLKNENLEKDNKLLRAEVSFLKLKTKSLERALSSAKEHAQNTLEFNSRRFHFTIVNAPSGPQQMPSPQPASGAVPRKVTAETRRKKLKIPTSTSTYTGPTTRSRSKSNLLS